MELIRVRRRTLRIENKVPRTFETVGKRYGSSRKALYGGLYHAAQVMCRKEHREERLFQFPNAQEGRKLFCSLRAFAGVPWLYPFPAHCVRQNKRDVIVSTYDSHEELVQFPHGHGSRELGSDTRISFKKCPHPRYLHSPYSYLKERGFKVARSCFSVKYLRLAQHFRYFLRDSLCGMTITKGGVLF